MEVGAFFLLVVTRSTPGALRIMLFTIAPRRDRDSSDSRARARSAHVWIRSTAKSLDSGARRRHCCSDPSDLRSERLHVCEPQGR